MLLGQLFELLGNLLATLPLTLLPHLLGPRDRHERELVQIADHQLGLGGRRRGRAPPALHRLERALDRLHRAAHLRRQLLVGPHRALGRELEVFGHVLQPAQE